VKDNNYLKFWSLCELIEIIGVRRGLHFNYRN